MTVDNDRPTASDRAEPADFGAWQHEARGNWIWLVPLRSWSNALEIAPAGSALPGALRRHFDHVHEVSLGAAQRLPFPDAMMSCVALHDARDTLTRPQAATLLAECHRVTEPGGWLFLGMPNASSLGVRREAPFRWAGRVACDALLSESSTHSGARTIRRVIVAAGFTEVRRYFAWPSQLAPYMLIPADRRAVIAHGHFGRKQPFQRFVRAMVARAGFYAPLFPVEIMLCRR